MNWEYKDDLIFVGFDTTDPRWHEAKDALKERFTIEYQYDKETNNWILPDTASVRAGLEAIKKRYFG